MANIKTHLNNIKGALYGKDVRGSIHDGIDAINKEVENTTGRQVDLENTFDQLVINAGNSNAEIVDARVKYDGTSYSKLGDRLDAVDSQLAHNVKDLNILNKNITSIYSFEQYCDDLNLNGIIVKDWSNALLEALKVNNAIYFPTGEYYFSKTVILLNDNIKLYGESKYETIIKYLGLGSLFVTDKLTSTKYLKIENISFVGNDNKNDLFNGRLYNSTIINCVFKNFKVSFSIAGVYVNFIENEFKLNNKALSILSCETDNGNVFSTCFNVEKCVFYGNTEVGITTMDDNVSDVIIKLNINNCGFEHNYTSIYIENSFTSKISNSWFENNKNKAKLVSQGWILENNRYELNDGIDFIEREGLSFNSGGHTQITSNNVETKELLLETHYNNTRVPTTTKSIKALRTSNNDEVVKIDNTDVIISAPNSSLHQFYYLIIERTGTVIKHNFYSSPTVTKNSTGFYEIDFGKNMGKYPVWNIQAMNGTQGDTFVRCVYNFGYTDSSTYNTYFSTSKIRVKIFNENNELVDGRILISLLTTNIKEV